MKIIQKIREFFQENNTVGFPTVTVNLKTLTYTWDTYLEILKIAQKAQKDIKEVYRNQSKLYDMEKH